MTVRTVAACEAPMIRRLMWLMFFVSVSFAEAQTVRITGTVQDAQIGSPIAGAPVYLLGSSVVAVTQENGRFILPDVGAGTYILAVAYKGYASASDTLVVSGEADIEHDFNLSPVLASGEEAAVRPQPGDQEAAPQLVLSPSRQDSLRAALKTVCDCFESAVGILNDAILLRKKYENAKEYQRDREAVEHMDVLLASWRITQYHCLTGFGTALFVDSACNRPDEISDIRRTLDGLGIKM